MFGLLWEWLGSGAAFVTAAVVTGLAAGLMLAVATPWKRVVP
jgi:hypothetical protein